ncbi:hypothetical protein ABL78_6467 [Leptomonas seymouri]|uniref:Uncharacterized protein n=1 Tax=Leptomonas seymouri TaxID=5684 RepID=A0A0N0P3S8_LEPSE|nr:hypothetical protein ABL78_6467 [Leptomonas seymouri]|eukprot:KPI84479.1 hypothetical protein ABL78_6467 [Leptomonas seymouri]
MYVFPVDGQEHRSQSLEDAHSAIKNPASMTEVFVGSTNSDTHAVESCSATPGLCASVSQEHAASRSSRCASVICVVTQEGEELHYPVVQGRAGGSIQGQTCGVELPTAKATARADVASRALHHASFVSASVSLHSNTPMECEEDELLAEAETYRQSRAAPSSIQRHRHSSRGNTRSPPPSVALRGEPVEDTVRNTGSQIPSPCSSFANTPRPSAGHTPECSPLRELSSVDGGAVRRTFAVVDGVPVRVEETGVSTPEMAEYFADSTVDAQRRTPGGFDRNVFRGSLSNPQAHRVIVSPRHSQQHGASALAAHPQPKRGVSDGSSGVTPTDPHATRFLHPMLDRALHLMEEQSKASQQLLQRMDALESTNKTLVDRLNKLERAMKVSQTGGEVVARVSAESASPSATRTSGSMDSATRPSTRAPSKAVN